LLILINPASSIGHKLNKHILSDDIEEFVNDWTKNLKKLALEWDKNKINKLDFSKEYNKLSEDFFSSCKIKKHQTDERIIKAINILETNSNKILSLDYISKKVFLSPSRFIHLFKIETGISYRRMQLWIRLIKSFDLLKEKPNLTKVAHSSGFSDSAHYSRTFKENFGIAPSLVLKNSQFIQV